MISPSRLMIARTSLEDLAQKCLQNGIMVAAMLSGNEPEHISWEMAAQIAVRMAVVIRRDVAMSLDKLLASEGADEFLRSLAQDAAKDLLEGGKP